MPENTLAMLRDFFNTETRPMTSADFAREYKALSTQDKTDIKEGILNGTLTY